MLGGISVFLMNEVSKVKIADVLIIFGFKLFNKKIVTFSLNESYE